MDTTKLTNGILCQMHPSEGYWLFGEDPGGQGFTAPCLAVTTSVGRFGRSPLIKSKHKNAISVQDGACILRLGREDTAGAAG